MATQPIKSPVGNKTYATVTVSTAATGLSDVIDIGNLALRSIETSSAWTAASLTFMGAVRSTDNMKSVRVTTAATELTYVSSVGYVLSVDPNNFAGLRYLQARSGTTTTPVAQAAERTLYFGLTKVDN